MPSVQRKKQPSVPHSFRTEAKRMDMLKKWKRRSY